MQVSSVDILPLPVAPARKTTGPRKSYSRSLLPAHQKNVLFRSNASLKKKKQRPKKPRKCMEKISIRRPADNKSAKKTTNKKKGAKRSIEFGSSSEKSDVDMILRDSTDLELNDEEVYVAYAQNNTLRMLKIG